jgi:hypothetical protein
MLYNFVAQLRKDKLDEKADLAEGSVADEEAAVVSTMAEGCIKMVFRIHFHF